MTLMKRAATGGIAGAPYSELDTVITAVGTQSLQILKELCDVQYIEELFGIGQATDTQIATVLAMWRYWVDKSEATRITDVGARRTTLNSLRV